MFAMTYLTSYIWGSGSPQGHTKFQSAAVMLPEPVLDAALEVPEAIVATPLEDGPAPRVAKTEFDSEPDLRNLTPATTHSIINGEDRQEVQAEVTPSEGPLATMSLKQAGYQAIYRLSQEKREARIQAQRLQDQLDSNRQLGSRIVELQSQLDDVHSRLDLARHQLREAKKTSSTLANSGDYDRLLAVHEAVTAERNEIFAALELEKQRNIWLSESLTSAQVDSDLLQRKLEKSGNELATLHGRHAVLDADYHRAVTDLQDAKDALAEAKQCASYSEREHDQISIALQKLKRESGAMKAELAETKAELEGMKKGWDATKVELETTKAALQDAKSGWEETKSELEDAQDALEEAQEQVQVESAVKQNLVQLLAAEQCKVEQLNSKVLEQEKCLKDVSAAAPHPVSDQRSGRHRSPLAHEISEESLVDVSLSYYEKQNELLANGVATLEAKLVVKSDALLNAECALSEQREVNREVTDQLELALAEIEKLKATLLQRDKANATLTRHLKRERAARQSIQEDLQQSESLLSSFTAEMDRHTELLKMVDDVLEEDSIISGQLDISLMAVQEKHLEGEVDACAECVAIDGRIGAELEEKVEKDKKISVDALVTIGLEKEKVERPAKVLGGKPVFSPVDNQVFRSPSVKTSTPRKLTHGKENTRTMATKHAHTFMHAKAGSPLRSSINDDPFCATSSRLGSSEPEA